MRNLHLASKHDMRPFRQPSEKTSSTSSENLFQVLWRISKHGKSCFRPDLQWSSRTFIPWLDQVHMLHRKNQCLDELIARKSKFGAGTMMEWGSKKLSFCSKAGFSYTLYLKDPCSVIMDQVNEIPLGKIRRKPYKLELYSSPRSSQVSLQMV